MKKLLIWLGIISPAKPATSSKKPNPPRVIVHTVGGVVVHRSIYHSLNNGFLKLHNEQGGGGLVAIYPPGSWIAVTRGRRSFTPWQQPQKVTK